MTLPNGAVSFWISVSFLDLLFGPLSEVLLGSLFEMKQPLKTGSYGDQNMGSKNDIKNMGTKNDTKIQKLTAFRNLKNGN